VIRASGRKKRVVLVAVTGFSQAEDKRQAELAGFDHHLAKPVDPDEIMALLDRLSVAME
jgi:CheY-like chemotaxis protein